MGWLAVRGTFALLPLVLAFDRGPHVAAAAGFAAFAALVAAGWGLWIGAAAAVARLAWQHTLVAPGRFERLDTAFFSANGALALLMFALYLLDMIVRA